MLVCAALVRREFVLRSLELNCPTNLVAGSNSI